MNITTMIIEIIIALVAIVSFITMLKLPHNLYFKNCIVEDLYASLTSLNYVNFTLQDICNITREVLPANYKYNISVNGTYICGDILYKDVYNLQFILVKNSTIYNITINIGK